jgi:hypothetical protein
MIDDEGTLSTTDVKARFVNGKPTAIEARYAMRSQFEWDRFIRFMDRWVGHNNCVNTVLGMLVWTQLFPSCADTLCLSHSLVYCQVGQVMLPEQTCS